MVLKDLLFSSLRHCLRSTLQDRTHRLGGPGCKGLCNAVKVWFVYQALRTWMIGGCSSTSTKVRSLLTVLWFNENPRIQNPNISIITKVGFSTSWASPQRCKNPAKNLLIDLPFKLGKFQGFSTPAIARVCGIFDLLTCQYELHYKLEQLTIGI